MLVNCEDFIFEIEHHCSLGKSDHDVLIFSLQGLFSASGKGKGELFNYKKGDYNKIRQTLSVVNWSVIEGAAVEENWQFIKKTVIATMNRYIPKIKPKTYVKLKPTA